MEEPVFIMPGHRVCSACKETLPEDEENFKLTGRRFSSMCNACTRGAKKPKRKRSKQSPEKTKKDQERRRRKYLEEVGPIPLCACGCGNEVKIPGKGTKIPKRLRGHGLCAESIRRSEFVAMVEAFKNERNLSHHDMANLMMVDYNYYSSAMFKKTEWLSMETAAAMIRPLLFAEGIHGDMIPKKAAGEGAKAKWSNAESKGYHRFPPLRDEFLALKEELGASWRTLGDFLDMDYVVLKSFWSEGKEYVTDASHRLWKKRMAAIRSLPDSTKAERFAPRPRAQLNVVERAPFVLHVHRFRQDMGYSSWKETAEAMGVSPDRLRGQLKDKKHKMMRKSTYDDLMGRMVELTHQRDRHFRHREATLDRMYLEDAS